MENASEYHINTLSNHAMIWLSISLSLAFIPHITHLPSWLTVLATAIISFKLLSLTYFKKPPNKWLMTILTFFIVIAIILEYSKLFGRDAGVALLSLMLFLKLLEAKSYRDGMILVGMTYFLVITNFFYNQDIPTAIYMTFTVLLITHTLIALNQRNIKTKDNLKSAGIIIFQALPLMVVLFILFPRIPGPLWGLPADSHSGRSGLSDEISPGKLSRLVLSNEVAFRVKFSKTPPKTSELYWRALVLWHFDGTTWRAGQLPTSPPTEYEPQSRAIDYTVTLEPHDKRWLFVLDIPNTQTQYTNAFFNHSHQLISKKPVINLKQYTASSYLEYTMPSNINEHEYKAGLQLPENSNPQTIALAQSWVNESLSDKEIVERALTMFYQNFTYTLNPPLLGLHSVDDFLFSKKKGFCGHFSSSFVFLLRAAGIPARVVAGYQGGELNPIGDYMLIRQADAHAWTEVWLKGQGWTRIDPTAAVSPTRIERGLDSAIPANENPRLTLNRNNPIISNLVLAWDSINNRWNHWVLGYGPESQRQFLNQFGINANKLYNLVIILTLTISFLLLCIGVWVFQKTRKNKIDPIEKIYNLFCNKMSKLGYARFAFEGPLNYSKRLIDGFPDHADNIKEISDLYSQLRYGRTNQLNDDLNTFKNITQKFITKTLKK